MLERNLYRVRKQKKWDIASLPQREKKWNLKWQWSLARLASTAIRNRTYHFFVFLGCLVWWDDCMIAASSRSFSNPFYLDHVRAEPVQVLWTVTPGLVVASWNPPLLILKAALVSVAPRKEPSCSYWTKDQAYHKPRTTGLKVQALSAITDIIVQPNMVEVCVTTDIIDV